MGTVDVSLVSWNSAEELALVLRSLRQQTLVPQSLTVVDNGSTDNSVDVAKAVPGVNVVALGKNTGFSRGHNMGIAQGTADYVLVINPDVRLEADYLEHLVRFADAHPTAAAFVGTVKNAQGGVDTTGLHIPPWRLIQERVTIPPTPQEVFGVSGAVALYRRAALQQTAVNGEFFCNLLFAYKEDVELAWRLRWNGWEAFCVPMAVATHARQVGKGAARAQRSADRRYLSYRNHILLYALVESWQTVLPHAWAVIPAELLRFIFLLCTDPRVTLHALADALKMWHAARTFAGAQPRKKVARMLRATF